MEGQSSVIDFRCTCGAHFALADEGIARQGRCPRCGTSMAEILGLLAETTEPAVPPAPPVSQAPEPLTVPRRPASSPAPPAASGDGERHRPALRLADTTSKPSQLPQETGTGAEPPAQDIPILLPLDDEPAPVSEPGMPARKPPAPAITPAQASQSQSRPPAQPARKTLQPSPPTRSIQPPAPKPPPPAPTPATPPALAPLPTLQPSASQQHLTVSKERAAHPGAPKCAIHGIIVTQNCMNCGKPICMECVHERGYFCSEECKKVVQAREGRRGGKGPKIGTTRFDKVRDAILKVKIPILLVLAGWAGWTLYMKFWGVNAKVIFSAPLDGEAFAIHQVEPDVIVYQAGDELRRTRVSTKEELWRTNLLPLEEKNTYLYFDEKATTVSEGQMEVSEKRDRLHLADVKGDSVIVTSGRQVLVFGANDGQLRWKYFKEFHRLAGLTVHEDGILCSIMPPRPWSARTLTNQPGGLLTVNFSLADGSEKWARTENTGSLAGFGNATLIHNGNLVSLDFQGTTTGAPFAYKYKPKAKPAKPKSKKEGSSKESKPKPSKLMQDLEGDMGYEPGELSGASKSDEDEYAEMEIDESAVPTGNYNLEFMSLSDGKVHTKKQLTLTAGGRAEKIGERLYLIAGAELLAYENGFDPVWRKKLPGFITTLADGGSNLAANTSKGIVVLDAKTGEQKWVGPELPRVQLLRAAPDGAVYATINVGKEDAEEGDARKYRHARMTTAGVPSLFQEMNALIKLNAKNGKLDWGVLFLGERVEISPEGGIYVIDSYLAPNALTLISGVLGSATPDLSIRRLSPRNGKDMWRYIVKADLHFAELVDEDKYFLVLTPHKDGAQMQYIQHKLF